MGRLLGLSFAICHLALTMGSCSSINCPVQNTVMVKYDVRGPGGVADTLRDTLWVLSRRMDGTDTLLLNRGVELGSFSLPVSYSHPEDTLIMLITDTHGLWTLDTLWLKKEDIPHFESVDCPPHFFHRITDVRTTHDGIDSVTIVNPNVTYDPKTTHLHIYFGGVRIR